MQILLQLLSSFFIIFPILAVEVFQFNNVIIDRKGNEIYRLKPNIEAFLLDNEMILAQHGEYAFYYDLFGNVKWKKKFEFHHHAKFFPELNQIWTIEYDVKSYNNRNVAFDSIVILNPEDGKIIKKFSMYSLLDQFKLIAPNKELDKEGSKVKKYFAVDERISDKASYVYNGLNFFHVVDEESKVNKFFKKGTVLLSFTITNSIVLVDKEFKRIVWNYETDSVLGQHTPVYKDDKILIYDNGLNGVREVTRIVLFDLKTNSLKTIFPLDNKTSDKSFFSKELGGAFYTNKQTIIFNNPSIDNNNLFEIDTDGNLVWEFSNKSGNNGYRANVVNLSKKTFDLLKNISE